MGRGVCWGQAMNLCETLKRVFASNPEPRGGKPKENNRIDTKTPPTAPEVHETLRDAMVAVGKDPLPVAHTPRKRDLAAIWPFSAPGVALITRPEIHAMAATLYGEARGQLWLGKLAVAYVILTRAQGGPTGKVWWWAPACEVVGDKGMWLARSLGAVCQAPKQFSCWNNGDQNRERCIAVYRALQLQQSDALDDQAWECLDAALTALEGEEDNPVPTATHYFNPSVVQPAWAEKMTPVANIGAHRFMREGGAG
jgi:N-acetylmuramoyl-L-alanine amidase